MSPMRSALCWFASVLVLASCARREHADRTPHPRAGEIWLTDAQVAGAGVKVEPADERVIVGTLTASAKIAFDDSRISHVFSPVSGRITSILGKPGERVKKGQVLAILESPDVGMASAELQKAEADRIAAEHERDRQGELLEANAASERDFEQAVDAARKAKAEVERAKQKTRLLQAPLTGKVTQRYAIRSETNGEIVARAATPGVEIQGQYAVGTAVELFTVGEIDRLWVLANVHEMDAPRVRVGDHARITPFAFADRVIESTVEWVSATLDPKSRTATVRCSVDNADRALKPEMYATMILSTEQRRVLAIPRRAVARLGERTIVFVDKGRSPDGRQVFARTPVTIDEREAGPWVAVVYGIERGTRIVVEGGILLSEAGTR